MDKELSKSICATLRPVALSKAEECRVSSNPCIAFKQRDLMLAWASKLCWHEWPHGGRWRDTKIYDHRCALCKKNQPYDDIEMCRPRFSIEPIDGHLSLVQFLKDAGEWEGFVEWHTDEIETVCYSGKSDDCYCHGSSAEILTSAELLAEAINSYFTREER